MGGGTVQRRGSRLSLGYAEETFIPNSLRLPSAKLNFLLTLHTGCG